MEKHMIEGYGLMVKVKDLPKAQNTSESDLIPLFYFVAVENNGRIKQVTEYFEDFKDAEHWVERFQALPSWKNKNLRILCFSK